VQAAAALRNGSADAAVCSSSVQLWRQQPAASWQQQGSWREAGVALTS